MKYGMHSCGLRSYPTKEALRKAGDFGYDGFEIDIFSNLNDRISWNVYRDSLLDDIPDLNDIMKKTGVEICSLCLGVLWFVNIASNDEKEKDLGVGIIKDCIQLASKLGAKCLLLPVGQPEEVSPVKARENLYNSIMKCIDEAEKNNVVLAVENVVQHVLWDCSDLIELVDRINSPYCKVYYDIGNPYFVDINPIEEIIRLDKRIYQIHIKDMAEVEMAPAVPKKTTDSNVDVNKKPVIFRGDRSNWTGKKAVTIGSGMVDWPGIVNAIKKIGYDRYLVTEINQDSTQPDVIAAENINAAKAVIKNK